MILTVTINPCVDKTVFVSGHKPHRIHRATGVTRIAGGKGVNVARMIRTLGEEAVALVCVGGRNGELILDLMAQEAIPAVPVPVGGESRTVTTILETDSPDHAQTAYVEPGAPIMDEARSVLFERFEALLDAASLVLLTGPSPNPESDDIYARMVALSRQSGRPTFLDSRGGAFRAAVERSPTLVKPNDAEATEWLGCAVENEATRRDAILALQKRGIPWAIVTSGAQGALVAVHDALYRVVPPPIETVNAVGSGDAMLGAMAVAWHRNEPAERIIRWGVAAGAANAAVWEAVGCSRADVESLVDRVRIERL